MWFDFLLTESTVLAFCSALESGRVAVRRLLKIKGDGNFVWEDKCKHWGPCCIGACSLAWGSHSLGPFNHFWRNIFFENNSVLFILYSDTVLVLNALCKTILYFHLNVEMISWGPQACSPQVCLYGWFGQDSGLSQKDTELWALLLLVHCKWTNQWVSSLCLNKLHTFLSRITRKLGWKALEN